MGAAAVAIPARVKVVPATFKALTDHLWGQGISLLVVIDEMEALYKSNLDRVRDVPQVVSNFAENDAGRTALIGYSSSSLLYPLVSGGKVQPTIAARHFPMLEYFHQDMNGEKLREIAISPTTSTATVAEFCMDELPGDNLMRHRRTGIALFALGGNVRRLHKGSLPRTLYAPIPAVTARDSTSTAYATAFNGANDMMAPLYDLLMGINGKLIASVKATAPTASEGVRCTIDIDTNAVAAVN